MNAHRANMNNMDKEKLVQKIEFIKLLGEVVKEYEDAIKERNDNRRYGMGDEEIQPSFHGFSNWLRNGWVC